MMKYKETGEIQKAIKITKHNKKYSKIFNFSNFSDIFI